jgi:hypothetical protein
MKINPDGSCEVTVTEQRRTGIRFIAIHDVIDMISQYQRGCGNDRANELLTDLARRLSEIEKSPSMLPPV